MAAAQFDTLRTLAFGGISGTYAVVGGVLTHPARGFILTNATAGNLFFSIDGVNDMFFVPAGGFILWDLAANASPIGVTDNLMLSINTQFWVRQSTAPTSGAVYIGVLYAKGE